MAGNAQTHLRSVPALMERETTDVKLTVPARPENVSVIRHVLGAFAEALRLPDELIEAWRRAVPEAGPTVVRHAAPAGRSGPGEISIRPEEERGNVVVADRGRAIGPSSDTTGP